MQRTQREINDAIIDEVLITGTANIAPADLKIIKGIAAEAEQCLATLYARLGEPADRAQAKDVQAVA